MLEVQMGVAGISGGSGLCLCVLHEAVAVLMDGGRIRIDISGYQNDMTTFHNRDDVMSLLIHLGYLGYDDETFEAFIPNREILDEFRTSTRSEEWLPTFRIRPALSSKYKETQA